MLRTGCHSALTAVLYIPTGIPVQLGHLPRKAALPLHLHVGSWMESDSSMFLLYSWIHFPMDRGHQPLHCRAVAGCVAFREVSALPISPCEKQPWPGAHRNQNNYSSFVFLVFLLSILSRDFVNLQSFCREVLEESEVHKCTRHLSGFRCRRSHSAVRPLGTACSFLLSVQCRM